MVRILAVSDVHGSQTGLDSTKRFIDEHKPDVVVVAGDITHFGPASWAREFLDSFETQVLAVGGNCDTDDVVAEIMARESVNLIDRHVEMLGLNFYGLGHPPHITETNIEKNLDVLVTHVPPKGCNDNVGMGEHIGNAQLRQLVLEISPRLVLSGHVHEARGICELGEAICVNPGPAMKGFGAVIDLDEKVGANLVNVGPL